MDAARFRRRLIGWFDRHQRPMPWRHDRDPYRVWVSEVMLQQTTVATVIPRFQRFIDEFPTVAALAAADEQQVLRAWEGLGYYRRARHLHQSAKILVERFGGTIPDDPAVWAELPGVGRYIFGAVLSQAFGKRTPIVEANSLRVLCRLFGQAGDPRSGPVQMWLWSTAEDLLPKTRPGDFNQAMMELGAVVCTPANPRCGECPVSEDCKAFADGTQASLPKKAARVAVTAVTEVAVVIRRGDEVFLAKRPDDAGRWAGMWEFPRGELTAGETHAAAAKRLLRERTGLIAKLGPEIATVRHGVTRYRIALTAIEATYTRGEFAPGYYSEGRWLRPATLTEFPVGTAQRRLADAVARAHRQRNLF